MPRTPPSRADKELIESLAAKGVPVTASQLDRWRAGGYFPPNKREGLGRGAGSRSELVPGAADYAEALACLAGQGRSMHQVMLSLFMAGIVTPERYAADDPLGETYEAAIRRAFRREIHQGAKAWSRVAARLAAQGADQAEAEDSLDRAFDEAERISKLRTARGRMRLENSVAALSGTKPRTASQLRREEQRAVLAATKLIPLDPERDEDEPSFEEIWHTGLVPLDAAIFARPDCATCMSKTKNYPTSPQGQRDILDSSSLTEINRARAIGGAVSLLVASVRDGALKNPDDKGLRGTVALIANTVFQVFLREPQLVDPRRPGSIVQCTLFFLNHCRWLRSGAALLAQDALNQMPTAGGDPSIPVAVGRAFIETAGRATILRQFKDGTGILLLHDGLAEAVKLIRSSQIHP